MVALPEGTVFLMCVPARMPDLRSLGYISGVCSRRPKSARCPLGTRTLQEKQEQRDLETRHEKTPLYSNFRETHLLGTPVVLVGHPGMLRVGYHGVEWGAFSACLRALVG